MSYLFECHRILVQQDDLKSQADEIYLLKYLIFPTREHILAKAQFCRLGGFYNLSIYLAAESIFTQLNTQANNSSFQIRGIPRLKFDYYPEH